MEILLTDNDELEYLQLMAEAGLTIAEVEAYLDAIQNGMVN